MGPNLTCIAPCTTPAFAVQAPCMAPVIFPLGHFGTILASQGAGVSSPFGSFPECPHGDFDRVSDRTRERPVKSTCRLKRIEREWFCERLRAFTCQWVHVKQHTFQPTFSFHQFRTETIDWHSIEVQHDMVQTFHSNTL